MLSSSFPDLLASYRAVLAMRIQLRLSLHNRVKLTKKYVCAVVDRDVIRVHKSIPMMIEDVYAVVERHGIRTHNIHM